MKRRGQHPDRELTALRIKSLSEPGRYADGNGLYLVVDASGAKRWMLRTVVRGRRRDIGLGGIQLVSLVQAREKATQLRRLAREGGDPLEQQRQARRAVPTFSQAAATVHLATSPSWRNPKHAAQWLSTLEQYAYPAFGDRQIDQIDTADLLRALGPIWLSKPETARRVKQRIGSVLDWARAAGFRTGENPVATVSRGLPRQTARAEHHAAMPYDDVPAFVGSLRSHSDHGLSTAALELLILTAARTGEVINARWEEFELDRAVWIIPASRMKSGREHRVPLSPRAVQIVAGAKERSAAGAFVFPGRAATKPASNMTLLMALRRLGVPYTAHGFRSSFRDWASERTNFPHEVCESALAHVVRNKVEAAYRRGDLFEKRRELMDAWSRFVCQSSAEVVALRA